MSATLEHAAVTSIRRETTRRLKIEREALRMGLPIGGWRNGKIIVRVPARTVEHRP